MGKGRDKGLISARDLKLFERYWYWTEVKRIRFDDAIRKIGEEEFFLSEGRVLQILRKMIRAGATVDGKTLPAQHFSGFRLRGVARPFARQLTLFD